MRNRYVKKCKCASFGITKKEVDLLPKGVLDISIEVICSECGRKFKEVNSKKTRMNNPQTSLEEIKEVPYEIDLEDVIIVRDPAADQKYITVTSESEVNDEPGNDKEEESSDINLQEEEPDAPKPEKIPKVSEEEDPARDNDEGKKEDEIKIPKTPKKRKPTASVEVPDRTVKEGLNDSGVPLDDLF